MAEITWANAVNGDFTTASYWTGGEVPGVHNGVNLAADEGTDYTVTVTGQYAVQSIETAANATLTISSYSTLTSLSGTAGGVNAGTISVGPRGTLVTRGILDNTGVLRSQDRGVITANGVDLTGGGIVDGVFFKGTELTNVNNDMTGQVDVGVRDFINESVVNSTTTGSGLGVYSRDIFMKNYGLIEATLGGSLGISHADLINFYGTILAANGSTVWITNNAGVEGGVIETSGSGVIYAGNFKRKSPSELSGFSPGGDRPAGITLDADIVVPDATGLGLDSAIINEGSITLDSTPSTSAPNGDQTFLYATGATLSGAGSVVLSDTVRNYISALDAGAALANVDNTVSGAGTIGGGGLVFTNESAGVVNADDSLALTLDDTAAMINDGLIEATGTGGLIIRSATVDDNGGGTISVAIGSKVLLDGGDIEGGTLLSTGGGVFKAIGAGNSLDGSTDAVAIDGEFVVAAGATLTGQGTIDNNARFVVQGSATLSAVDNTSVLETDGGDLAVLGALTGAGEALIDGGTMTFGAATGQKVVFDNAGELILADSQGYSGTVWKFSTTGTDTLDLEDIAFGDDSKATYSGLASGGVLTVTNGTLTIKIAMKGDFLSSTFTVADDGNGGTLVTDPTAAPALAQALAGFGASPAGAAAQGLAAPTTPNPPSLAVHG